MKKVETRVKFRTNERVVRLTRFSIKQEGRTAEGAVLTKNETPESQKRKNGITNARRDGINYERDSSTRGRYRYGGRAVDEGRFLYV